MQKISAKYETPASGVEVWVPLRISGFFQIMDPTGTNRALSPTEIGSRGGGPALTAFGKTRIIRHHNAEQNAEVNPPESNHAVKIWITNQEVTASALTSRSVVDQFIAEGLLPPSFSIEVYHTFDLPIGCGYGSSGAGALGIAHGLNSLFELGLSDQRLGKMAHIAEVTNHTGLGTVGGQLSGGLSVTIEPGFPFALRQILVPDDVRIIVASWGEISTSVVLTNPEYRVLIHNAGKRGMDRLLANFTLETYLDVCSTFLEETQLLERFQLDFLTDLLTELQHSPALGASLNQLGKSVFCFCWERDIDTVRTIFQKFLPPMLQIVQVCPHGPMIKRVWKDESTDVEKG